MLEHVEIANCFSLGGIRPHAAGTRWLWISRRCKLSQTLRCGESRFHGIHLETSQHRMVSRLQQVFRRMHGLGSTGLRFASQALLPDEALNDPSYRLTPNRIPTEPTTEQ